MGGELGDPGGLPPSLGHSIQGGSGGLAPMFRPRRARGVRGAEPPVYKCTAYKGGSGGLAPRFGRVG